MTATMPRPSLGARAVSDMAPLVSRPMVPTPDAADAQQHRGQVDHRLNGTRAVVGGRNVAAGAELRRGGRAPKSPFLSLPPAPEADHVGGGGGAHAGALHSTKFARAGSEGSIKDPTVLSVAAARSWTMVRSYSMPVATQAEFEKEYAARRAGLSDTATHHVPQSWDNGWSMSSSSFGNQQGGAIIDTDGEQQRTISTVKRRRFDKAAVSPRGAGARLAPLAPISDNAMREDMPLSPLSKSFDLPLDVVDEKMREDMPLSPLSKSFDLPLDVVDENVAPAAPLSLERAASSSMMCDAKDYFSLHHLDQARTDRSSSDSDEEVATPRATPAPAPASARVLPCSKRNTVDFDHFDWINPAHFAPPEHML